ncbi:tau 95 subunit of transcription factor TFIIIC [Vermiconidia calcicola]|uniref:Tau 95 subunit of transcription factor TFIIIC n=1 Tax=Vermiconidia calcicola TaxID=1690605 RepID=A0ACC3MKU7_9PEZI|nr:tau 95 subunit of transcription factor TFIIIC [Vermiconidia calcicola]
MVVVISRSASVMPPAAANGANVQTYRVPQERIVLEHEVGETRSSTEKDCVEPVAGVSLRPNDPFAKKLSSVGMPTQNILMKVTIPKRTGRKRKRGANGSYIDASPSEMQDSNVTGPELLQRMRDNPDRFDLELVGRVTDTHRFRPLPDFQVRAEDVPIMRELRDHAMVPNYGELKALKVNVEPGPDDLSSFPGPASFLPPTRAPRPAVQRNERPKTQPNIQKPVKAANPPKLQELGVAADAEEMPDGPSASLPAPDTQPVIQAIAALRQVLEERPIVTRRVALSKLNGHKDASVRCAIPYLGYYLGTGPWRHTIVKYGVDPRKSPEYRMFQTISFSRHASEAITKVPGFKKPVGHIHVFDGKSMPDPSNMWQLCDLTDPTLQHLVQTTDVRSEYNKQWGWYGNGTIAKICIVMRDKMIQLASNNPKTKESEYMFLANLKNDVKEARECYLDHTQHGKHLCDLAEAIGDEAIFGTVTKLRGYEEVAVVSSSTRAEDDFGGTTANGGQSAEAQSEDRGEVRSNELNMDPDTMAEERGDAPGTEHDDPEQEDDQPALEDSRQLDYIGAESRQSTAEDEYDQDRIGGSHIEHVGDAASRQTSEVKID